MAKAQADTDGDTEVRSERRATDGAVVDASLRALDTLEADTLVCGIYADVRPLPGLLGYIDWRLCGRLSRLLEAGTVTGARGEHVLIPTLGRVPAPRLLLIGFGTKAEARGHEQERLHELVEVVNKAKGKRVAVGLPSPAQAESHAQLLKKGLHGTLVATFT